MCLYKEIIRKNNLGTTVKMYVLQWKLKDIFLNKCIGRVENY